MVEIHSAAPWDQISPSLQNDRLGMSSSAPPYLNISWSCLSSRASSQFTTDRFCPKRNSILRLSVPFKRYVPSLSSYDASVTSNNGLRQSLRVSSLVFRVFLRLSFLELSSPEEKKCGKRRSGLNTASPPWPRHAIWLCRHRLKLQPRGSRHQHQLQRQPLHVTALLEPCDIPRPRSEGGRCNSFPWHYATLVLKFQECTQGSLSSPWSFPAHTSTSPWVYMLQQPRCVFCPEDIPYSTQSQ